jgi:hypothetical protein
VFTQPLTETIKKMFLHSRVRPVSRADNLNAIYEPTVYAVWYCKVSQPYRSAQHDTGIALTVMLIIRLPRQRLLLISYLYNKV